MLVAIVPAAYSVGGFELITMLVASNRSMHNSTHCPLNQVFSRGSPTPYECHQSNEICHLPSSPLLCEYLLCLRILVIQRGALDFVSHHCRNACTIQLSRVVRVCSTSRWFVIIRIHDNLRQSPFVIAFERAGIKGTYKVNPKLFPLSDSLFSFTFHRQCHCHLQRIFICQYLHFHGISSPVWSRGTESGTRHLFDLHKGWCTVGGNPYRCWSFLLAFPDFSS